MILKERDIKESKKRSETGAIVKNSGERDRPTGRIPYDVIHLFINVKYINYIYSV